MNFRQMRAAMDIFDCHAADGDDGDISVACCNVVFINAMRDEQPELSEAELAALKEAGWEFDGCDAAWYHLC